MLAVDFNTEIKYDRITKDFNLFIEGEYVGSAASYGEGRYRLDDLVRDKLTHGDHLTATQLDGGDPEAVNWNLNDYETPPPPIDDPIEQGPGEEDDVDGVPQGKTCRGCGERFRDHGSLCYACLSRGPKFF